MSVTIVLLYVVEVVVCLLLALVVMLQKPKEGGLGGAIGGGMLEASLGADAGSFLIKATSILGVIFLLNTLLLARLTSSSASLRSTMAGEAAASAAEQSVEIPAVAADPQLPVESAPAPTPAPVPAK